MNGHGGVRAGAGKGGHAGGGHSSGVHSVRSYTTKNGTHFAAHHATNRNGSRRVRRVNYLHTGKVNPYTAKKDTKN